MIKEFNKTIININHASERLDKFLTKELAPISRSQIQKMILSGDVTVNGIKPTVHRWLKINDVVVIKNPDTKKPSPQVEKMDLEIIAENPDYIVINKPAGIAVHPSIENLDTNRALTIADIIRAKYPEIKSVGDKPELRPGIVHRLDKDVSGLMVIAKNQPTFLHFKKQFQDRQVKKTYIALVHGHLPKTDGTINFSIERSKNKAKMAAKSAGQTGKEAITKYKVKEYLGGTEGEWHGYSLLEIEILTGRTNQIRVHLQAISHPVVGDKIYHLNKYKPAKINRVLLYSAKIGFFDRENQWQEYNLKTTPELKKFISNI